MPKQDLERMLEKQESDKTTISRSHKPKQTTMDPVYLKNTQKINIVPKISTEQYRRRFAVDLDKIKSRQVKMDAEHCASSLGSNKKLPAMRYAHTIDPFRPSINMLKEELQRIDREVISKIGQRQLFNDISSIQGEAVINKVIEEEESCSFTDSDSF